MSATPWGETWVDARAWSEGAPVEDVAERDEQLREFVHGLEEGLLREAFDQEMAKWGKGKEKWMQDAFERLAARRARVAVLSQATTN